MAVRHWWRLWKRPGQREEEKGIGTNPTGVKHRSSYSCPIPAFSSTISSRNHWCILVSPPLRLLVSPALPFTRMLPRFDVSLEKLTRALCLPYHRKSSFRMLFASVGFHGNFFSLFLPAYLSIYSYLLLFVLFYSSADPSLIFLSQFTFALFPLSSDFLCKRPQVDLWHYCSRATSSPTDSTKAGVSTSFIFHYLLPARYP